MKINPDFRDLIPPITADEYAQLETNILKDGCRDPLVTWNGELLDGHNRYAICQQHGIEFSTTPMRFVDANAAKVWIIRNQFARRNISLYVRAELALKLEALLKPAIQAKAKENQGTRTDIPQNSARCLKPIETRVELAKSAGVSHDTLAKAKVIEARASEETKAALRTGETSIHAEWKKLTVHVGQNSGENEWYTPAALLDAARKAMGAITCDPASSEIANKTVRAEVFFTKEQDGLNQKWKGSVFLNPPYAQPLVADFSDAVCEKLEAKEINQAIVLVNNATETVWFQQMLSVAVAVCFIKGRVKFLDPSGNPGAPLQGQAVLCLGGNATQFQKAFSQFGPVLFRELV